MGRRKIISSKNPMNRPIGGVNLREGYVDTAADLKMLKKLKKARSCGMPATVYGSSGLIDQIGHFSGKPIDVDMEQELCRIRMEEKKKGKSSVDDSSIYSPEEFNAILNSGKRLSRMVAKAQYRYEVAELFRSLVCDIESIKNLRKVEDSVLYPIRQKYNDLVDLAQIDDDLRGDLRELMQPLRAKYEGKTTVGTEEERKTMSMLVNRLMVKRGYRARFGRELSKFLEMANVAESYNSKSLPGILFGFGAGATYSVLSLDQRDHPKDELLGATMDYLRLRYPDLTKPMVGEDK
jgi:hypothetical protein